MAFLLVFQLKKSIGKVKQISSPNDLVPWAETYSATSLYMVRLMQASIAMSILSNGLSIVAVMIEDKYAKNCTEAI